MRRILFSALMIGFTVALVAGVTAAYFSDTETSVGNTLTAGTLDLTVDGKEGANVVHVTRTNLVPAAPWTTQYGQQWVLKNVGSVGGTVTATIKNLKDYENGCGNPEVNAGDTTCGTGADQGELSALLTHVQWSINEAPWGRVLTPAFTSLKDANGVPVTGVNFHLNAGQSIPAYLNLNWDTTPNDNKAQGDGVEFDVEFVLNQDH
ncbi:MAG: CalY family protein [Patescibacteria group bacterium]|nr:CalY family protein [Patescibacteria group bacterium]